MAYLLILILAGWTWANAPTNEPPPDPPDAPTNEPPR